MRKVYKKLTEEQKKRGVIFSSQLMPNGTLHEVTEENRADIGRLSDDSFFNKSHYTYNEIRRG
jgi:hypothetical protein